MKIKFRAEVFLLILSGLCLLSFAACTTQAIILTLNPSPTPLATSTIAPSATQTATPTASPVPTFTPSPSPTPTLSPTATMIPTPTAFGGYQNNRLVAWLANRQNVIISHTDGTNPVYIKEAFGKSLVGWTPDGQWILFTESCYGLCNSHLWAARPNGSEVKLIFTNQNDSHFLSWHPDGERFLINCGPDSKFVIQNPARNINLKICQGTTRDFSITPTNLLGFHPQYSPDGNWIAWYEITNNQDPRLISGTIIIQDLQQEQPPIKFKLNSASDLKWNPDSRGLVYVSMKELGKYEIYQVKMNEPTARLLVKLDSYSGGSTGFLGMFSPDGKHLVYMYQNKNYILNLDAPETPILTRAPIGARLIWTPDGNLLALTPGIPTVIIDPHTGLASDLKFETPWFSISKWAPSWRNFYYETYLQP